MHSAFWNYHRAVESAADASSVRAGSIIGRCLRCGQRAHHRPQVSEPVRRPRGRNASSCKPSSHSTRGVACKRVAGAPKTRRSVKGWATYGRVLRGSAQAITSATSAFAPSPTILLTHRRADGLRPPWETRCWLSDGQRAWCCSGAAHCGALIKSSTCL